LSLEQIADRVAPVAEEHNLKAVWVFGSYARDEAGAGSDVDLLIDIEGAIGTEWMCSGIFAAFENQFGAGNVDMITTGSLVAQPRHLAQSRRAFRENVLRERKQVYERQGPSKASGHASIIDDRRLTTGEGDNAPSMSPSRYP
jgi:predicted nucleotidyltransferase